MKSILLLSLFVSVGFAQLSGIGPARTSTDPVTIACTVGSSPPLIYKNGNVDTIYTAQGSPCVYAAAPGGSTSVLTPAGVGVGGAAGANTLSGPASSVIGTDASGNGAAVTGSTIANAIGATAVQKATAADTATNATGTGGNTFGNLATQSAPVAAGVVASDGSTLINYKYTAQGAFQGSSQDLVNGGPSSADVVLFGADPTGVADSTAACQAASNTHKTVYFRAGTYKISSCSPTLNTATNTINSFIGEFGGGRSAVLINGTSTTAAIFSYAVGSTEGSFGPTIAGFTFSYPQGGGCIAFNNSASSGNVINLHITHNRCVGRYTTGNWTTSPDPNYRTNVVNSLSTMQSYGTGLHLDGVFDSRIEINVFQQNGIAIYCHSCDVGNVEGNRFQVDGWPFYAVDGTGEEEGKMTIQHNDFIENGAAGGMVQLNQTYYYAIQHNYFENFFASSQAIKTTQDYNTSFTFNDADFICGSACTVNPLYQFSPVYRAWVFGNTVHWNTANVSFVSTPSQCNATYFVNSLGGDQRNGSVLCEWPKTGNGEGFPFPNQPGVVTQEVDSYVMAYNNPNVVGGTDAQSFPWVTSGTTGQFVIDTSKAFSWTIPLDQTRLGYQSPGLFQFNLRIKARALTNPSGNQVNVSYFDGVSTTTTVAQTVINFTDTAFAQTLDVIIQIPVTTIGPNATLSFNIPRTTAEVESMQLIAMPPQVLDYGTVSSGTWSIDLSSPAPIQKITLGANITSIVLNETLNGHPSYNGKIITFQVCQDATGSRTMPSGWGSLFGNQAFLVPSNVSSCFFSLTAQWVAASNVFQILSQTPWQLQSGAISIPGGTFRAAALLAGFGAQYGISSGGVVTGATYVTSTNCSSSASPAVCAAAAAGQVQIAAAATSIQINTTAVTANSRVGCLTYSTVGITAPANIASLMQPYLSGLSAGVSFTLTIPVAPLTNAVNLQYCLIN